MERPTITIEGKSYEMKKLTGKDWRIFGELTDAAPNQNYADMIENHADFISKFYDVTKEEILEKMALEEILPASRAIQNSIVTSLTAKIRVIEKNSATDKEQ